ncbi:MAG TPA: GTPase Era [Clostridia bacterium]|nr:GTPase Era [Clostridia bacterium]
MDKKFKSGFVTIIGRPNVGKSTLINRLLGERVSIISSKPQTTRNSIRCIYTNDEYQIVFIDTPGIHKPRHALGEYMVKTATESLKGVDVVIVMFDCSAEIGPGDMHIIEVAGKVDSPVILVLNKIDRIAKSRLEQVAASLVTHENHFDAIIPISASTGENLDELLKEIVKHLPEGPKYFTEDIYTDMPEKFIVSEIIREKILELTEEEVPHGTAVDITSMKERENKDLIDIEATIFCEKDSHKGMIIGKQGKMLKEIGTRARVDIESLLDCKINLQLWVKVKNDWRDNKGALKNFGYKWE